MPIHVIVSGEHTWSLQVDFKILERGGYKLRVFALPNSTTYLLTLTG